ncbi:nuclear transport factor 2 family protein [uncultured Aquimarina sp.]|uniref:nuclear transport factor 2 family protein n=1 Tax=uncultured Aquimarina sp. TaxID=575652 RepID=UPI00260F9236|nr:nuclear transport factor 2 family protein [uncultured Aquimarina sp.]
MDTNQKNAKQAVLDFFEGFHSGDTVQIKKTILSMDMVMQTIFKTKDGKVKTNTTKIEKFLEAIHNRPKDQKWLEKLLDFRVDADDRIAQIWTPYEFYVNDQFSHCGVNIFQLFNDGKTWRIIAIADTRKREGCK